MSITHKIKGFVLSSLLVVCLSANAVEPFDRHYIVVVDQTIKSNNANIGVVYKSLCSWFNGEKPTSGLNMEGSTIPEPIGFDVSHDALSLFAFGLPGDGFGMKSDYGRIHRESYGNGKNAEFIFSDIVESLIKKRNRYYDGKMFSLDDNNFKIESLSDFLSTDMRKLFDGTDPLHVSISQESGITMSHFVYPLIMNFISKEETAKEYYLILISDFKSGLYSNNDEDDWRTLSAMTASKTEIRKYFEKQINSMRAPFVQADYLHFQAGDIGAKGTRLVMKSLIQKSQVFLSSSLSLSQSSGSTFKVSSAKIAFDKDPLTTIDSIQIILSENGKVLCRKTIERGDDAIARLLGNNREYEIPSQKLDLGKESLKDITVGYQLYTMSHDASGNPVLPVALSATQNISEDDISMINKERRKIMTITSIMLLVIAALLILIMRGRKKKAEIIPSEFLDEYVDVTPERGAVRQSCLFYKIGQKPAPIPVKVNILGRHSFFAFPWKEEVYAYVDDSLLPESSYYNDDNGNKKEAIRYVINNDYDNRGKWVLIEKDSKGNYKFNIHLLINEKHVDLSRVQNMRIDIVVAVKTNFFGVGRPKGDIAEYEIKREQFCHYLIEDLGNAWIGIDPGTTGSCIAISGDAQGAADNPSIDMVEVKRGQELTNIIPSKLVLDKPSITTKTVDEMEPGVDYEYGVNADQTWVLHVNSGDNCYQSIKKLLGYKKTDDDKIVAKFRNNTECSFTGVELAYLLVKGLKKSLDDYINSLPQQKRQIILPDGQEARRAVVAIPNNYTLSKTLDMVNSIKMLKSFQEVRFIYEAEGVLFNYLCKTYGKKKAGQENVMVFDMGGATINVSVFNINYFVEDHTIRFNVRTLARIGYAVGGDNIDVALLETLLTMPELGEQAIYDEEIRHSFEAKNKTKFLDADHIFGLKKELVSGGKGSVYALANHGNFINFVNRFLKDDIEEGAFDDMKENFTARIWKRLSIDSQYMRKFIYNNVTDAIKEVLKFKEVTSLDRVIFSGRSTMFPEIKNTVIEALGKVYSDARKKVWNGLTDEEIKTCVANGACWYGRYGLVTLDNSLINGSYGFKYTEESGKHLHILLSSDLSFEGNNPLTGVEEIESAFRGDGGNVCFYQVMGNGDTENIFADENRHKLNFLGAVHLKNKTSQISMAVDRRNKVTGTIQYESGHIDSLNVEAEDHDLVNENEWPYIFHTLTEDQNVRPQQVPSDGTVESTRGGRRRR